MKPEDALPALAAQAVDYIRNAASTRPGQPFFLYVPLTAPHTPVAPNRAYPDKNQAGAYGDFTVETDEAIGRVMTAIDQAGLKDSTLLIVTSDNGPENPMHPRKLEFQHFSAAHFLGNKRDNWEGGHRIPFIARWPGNIPAGTVSDEIICLTDLMRTCAVLTGAAVAADAAEDSYDILPALTGRRTGRAIREATVHHSSEGEFSIRQGQWKLLLHPGSGGNNYRNKPGYAPYYEHPIQLYDVNADPGETVNLAGNHADVVASLTDLLERYVNDGRSTPGPRQTNDTSNDWKQLRWMKPR
jgi:arylsulfatase A-like enzyme